MSDTRKTLGGTQNASSKEMNVAHKQRGIAMFDTACIKRQPSTGHTLTLLRANPSSHANARNTVHQMCNEGDSPSPA